MMFKRFEPSALIVPAAVAMRMANLAGLHTRTIKDEITDITNRISGGEQVQVAELVELIAKQQQQTMEQKAQLEKLQLEISGLKENV